MARIDKRKPPEFVPVTPAETYENIFINLACDMVKVSGEDVPETVPQSFIVRSLISSGRVGFIPGSSAISGWFMAEGVGQVDRWGFFRELWCYPANRERGFYRKAPAVKEIRANATGTALLPLFHIWSRQLSACDGAIMANMESNRYGRMIGVPNEMKDSVRIALLEGRNGAPMVVESSLLAAMQNSDISVPYTAPTGAQVWQFIWSKCVRQLGGICSEQYRQERTQSAEVNASIGESIDHIYTMIDQFNADCKYHGVRAKMEYNGFAARYDEQPKSEPEPDTGRGAAGAAGGAGNGTSE